MEHEGFLHNNFFSSFGHDDERSRFKNAPVKIEGVVKNDIIILVPNFLGDPVECTTPTYILLLIRNSWILTCFIVLWLMDELKERQKCQI